MDTQTFAPVGPPAHLIKYLGMLVGGVIVGIVAAPYLPFHDPNDTYQAGFNAAKKVVEDSSAGNIFRTPDDVRILSGTVTAIDGNRLAFRINSVNPFDDPALANRTIIVNDSTAVLKLTQKDPKVFQAEMIESRRAKQGAMATSTPIATSVTPYIQTAGSVKDIAEGDSLTVFASENIKTSKEFPAKEISIMPKLIMSKLIMP